eukprot:c5728_g1_i1 orf=100-318(-)
MNEGTYLSNPNHWRRPISLMGFLNSTQQRAKTPLSDQGSQVQGSNSERLNLASQAQNDRETNVTDLGDLKPG